MNIWITYLYNSVPKLFKDIYKAGRWCVCVCVVCLFAVAERLIPTLIYSMSEGFRDGIIEMGRVRNIHVKTIETFIPTSTIC